MGILKKAIDWFTLKLELDELRNTLDVECPHDPLKPCDDCDIQDWAHRW